MRAANFMRFFITGAFCLLAFPSGLAQEEHPVASHPCLPANRGGGYSDTGCSYTRPAGQQSPSASTSSSAATAAANPDEGKQTKRIL